MESLLTIDELVLSVNGKLVCDKNKDKIIFTNVATDSRNVTKNTLFVPLIGEFQNGHKYISSAIENGASVIFVAEEDYNQNIENYKKLCLEKKEVCFILVKNTLYALQDAACFYVSKFPTLVKISITGSCGKTTTKEMLVSIFKAKYKEDVVYTKGNFNSETGLPLSVFNIKNHHKIGIFEMGMNRENEIGEISKVLKSKYGIITNIGNAHIGLLGSRQNIAKEKRKSFNYIPKDGAVFVPKDDDFCDYCCEGVSGKIVKYGSSVSSKESGVVFIKDLGLSGMLFSVDGLEVKLNLSGMHNFENALGVIALAKECGIESSYIKQGLETLGKISGRMESELLVLKNNEKVNLVKDCYNANPDSMKKVIDWALSLENVNKKIFVLADMKELGNEAKQGHEEIGRALCGKNYDCAIFIGQDMKYAFDVLGGTENKKNYYFDEKSEETFKKIGQILLEVSKTDDVIVLKGSHSMGLEKLVCEVCDVE